MPPKTKKKNEGDDDMVAARLIASSGGGGGGGSKKPQAVAVAAVAALRASKPSAPVQRTCAICSDNLEDITPHCRECHLEICYDCRVSIGTKNYCQTCAERAIECMKAADDKKKEDEEMGTDDDEEEEEEEPPGEAMCSECHVEASLAAKLYGGITKCDTCGTDTCYGCVAYTNDGTHYCPGCAKKAFALLAAAKSIIKPK